jgi:hypothetical protein
MEEVSVFLVVVLVAAVALEWRVAGWLRRPSIDIRPAHPRCGEDLHQCPASPVATRGEADRFDQKR